MGKQPQNYKSLSVGGTALWEIWVDDGPHTGAYPLLDPDSLKPHIFLYDDEAAGRARDLAERHPYRRYAVKESSLSYPPK